MRPWNLPVNISKSKNLIKISRLEFSLKNCSNLSVHSNNFEYGILDLNILINTGFNFLAKEIPLKWFNVKAITIYKNILLMKTFVNYW